METPKYPFEITLLSEEDGPGYLIIFPDLPGCIRDGETVEEALANGADAEKTWIQAATEWGDAVPKPGRITKASGKFIVSPPQDSSCQVIKTSGCRRRVHEHAGRGLACRRTGAKTSKQVAAFLECAD